MGAHFGERGRILHFIACFAFIDVIRPQTVCPDVRNHTQLSRRMHCANSTADDQLHATEHGLQRRLYRHHLGARVFRDGRKRDDIILVSTLRALRATAFEGRGLFDAPRAGPELPA
jgi:hypothetical protein